MNKVRIAIDGNFEQGPDVLFESIEDLLNMHPNLDLGIAGKDEDYSGLHNESFERRFPDRVILYPVEEYVDASQDFRNKVLTARNGDTSIRKAFEISKPSGYFYDAIVTHGDTAGLGLIIRRLKKEGTLVLADDKIQPALASFLPSLGAQHKKRALWLDIGLSGGQNTFTKHHFTPEYYVALAKVGVSIFASEMEVQSPLVALTSTATEGDSKQPLQLAAAHKLLQGLHDTGSINYYGIEEGEAIGPPIINDGVQVYTPDVVVTNGYVGNWGLKHFESLAEAFMYAAFEEGLEEKALGDQAEKTGVAEKLKTTFGPDGYNGAYVVGVNLADTSNGHLTVIKGHGKVSKEGFIAAVDRAYRAVESNMMEEVGRVLKTNSDAY